MVFVMFHPHRGEPQAVLSWENDPGSVDTGRTRENPGKKIRHSPVEIRSIRPGETDFRAPPARFPRREALEPQEKPSPIEATTGPRHQSEGLEFSGSCVLLFSR